MDNKMRKILIQLGASYELAGRKLTDDTLLGAAKETIGSNVMLITVHRLTTVRRADER